MSRFLLVYLFSALLASVSASPAQAEHAVRRGLLSSEGSSGALIIVGGGPTSKEVYNEFVRLAGGPDARVVHIPTATSRYESIPNLREYYSEWFEHPLKSFDFMHTRSADEARRPEFAEPLKEATGVWIGGGDQNKLMESYSNTPVLPAIHDLIARGGVVAGTSSGAAIMSESMICDETYTELVMGRGFALCPRAIVEPHLTQRHRVQRLLSAIASQPDQIGIGVDEKTALVIQNQQVRVIGEGHVSFFVTDGKTGLVTRHRLQAGQSAHPQMVLSTELASPELAKRDEK